MKNNYSCFFYIVCVFLLNACSNFSEFSYFETSIKIPKVPPIKIPGELPNTSWRYLGITPDNLVSNEIDDKSIQKINDQIYQFTDRKTIQKPELFIFNSAQKKYKYSIGTWQINCQNQTYIILQITLYDINGTLIQKIDYSNNLYIKWFSIGNNSIAYAQYQYICLNYNRFLGY